MFSLLYYYTLIVMLLVIFAGAACFSCYLVSHLKSCAYAALMFVFYFFDVSLVFQDDFIARSIALPSETFYAIGNPMVLIVTGLGAIGCFWLIVCQTVGEHRRGVIGAPCIAFVVLSVAAFFVVGDAQWRMFLFFGMRELFLFAIYLFYAQKSVHADPDQHAVLRFKRSDIVVCAVLTAGIVAENFFTQIVFDPSLLANRATLWHFAERNFLENFLFLWIAFVIVRQVVVILRTRFDNPPVPHAAHQTQAMEELLPIFCKQYGLSPRERDVLKALLEGLDDQNMASQFNLSKSTIKNHVHSILKKTEAANRKELCQRFWQG